MLNVLNGGRLIRVRHVVTWLEVANDDAGHGLEGPPQPCNKYLIDGIWICWDPR